MLTLPEESFGYKYAFYMTATGLSPDERPLVKYVSNLEHAYILQRYKETHDMTHLMLDYGISVSEEIAVKWFEMIQTELPMNALASFVGPMNLILLQRDIQQLNKLTQVYLPHIMMNSRSSKLLMNVYYEKYFETDIDDFRK